MSNTNRDRATLAALSAFGLTAGILLAAFAVGPSPVHADSHDVSIVDSAFQPSTLTVFVGEPVTWTNNAARDHTVTSDEGTELDSGAIHAGEAYGHVFEQPGTYAYHCEIHPDRMKGTITVKAAPVTPTPSGSPEPTPPSGTLPPDFSPFPSTGPVETSPPPSASPTPAATPIRADTTGGGGVQPLLLVLLGAAALGVIAAVWLRRRGTTST